MKQRIILLEISGDELTKEEEFNILESIGNIVKKSANRTSIHTWFDDEAMSIDLSPEEWKDFSAFIASQSTHNISSYPEDGVFHRCPYSTMDRSIEAFRCYQRIVKEGTSNWDQLEAFSDVDCSDAGHYYDRQDEEQETPEPEPDYEPEYIPSDYYETLSKGEDTLTSEEEAKLEESDKFFEELGLLG